MRILWTDRNYPFPGKKGFTLIELLVVIAIIGLLVSILMPALTAARKQAQSAVCMTQLKQMGYATYYYAEDNKDYVPRGTAGSGKIWFELLMPYLEQQARVVNGVDDYRHIDIYRCPGYPTQSEAAISYVINNWADNRQEVSQPTKLTKFPGERDETIYLADSESGDWRPVVTASNSAEIHRMDVFAYTHMPYSEVEDVTWGRRIAQDRHSGGANCLFLDWHVENVAAYDMLPGMWSGLPQDWKIRL
ncbi:MAG: prepilin-type N-terminal cleavage/methylation domain-containing protein [Sedimentisphaerales bacterium]|nr:prepilin-type N-terminal cleavage/methylation domain-containing protein [Sedimentisphaerales bacterium]